MMAIRGKSNREKYGIKCQRCKGRMAFEKNYGLNEVFFGWHCLICGDIIDSVILLHRISQNADITIPETQGKIIAQIQKYMNARQRRNEHKMGTDKNK